MTGSIILIQTGAVEDTTHGKARRGVLIAPSGRMYSTLESGEVQFGLSRAGEHTGVMQLSAERQEAVYFMEWDVYWRPAANPDQLGMDMAIGRPTPHGLEDSPGVFADLYKEFAGWKAKKEVNVVVRRMSSDDAFAMAVGQTGWLDKKATPIPFGGDVPLYVMRKTTGDE